MRDGDWAAHANEEVANVAAARSPLDQKLSQNSWTISATHTASPELSQFPTSDPSKSCIFTTKRRLFSSSRLDQFSSRHKMNNKRALGFYFFGERPRLKLRRSVRGPGLTGPSITYRSGFITFKPG